MPKTKNETRTVDVTKPIDLSKLTAEQREAVKRALYPRDTVLSLRFPAQKIAAWKRAAKVAEVPLTDWMEQALDRAQCETKKEKS